MCLLRESTLPRNKPEGGKNIVATLSAFLFSVEVHSSSSAHCIRIKFILHLKCLVQRNEESQKTGGSAISELSVSAEQGSSSAGDLLEGWKSMGSVQAR